jgi:hypothetical protein
MRKILYGLLGAALLFSPLKGIGQNLEKKSYEYNIYLGDTDIGDAVCNSNNVNFNIDWLLKQDLTFSKKGNYYFESLKTKKLGREDEEKYYYSKSDSLRLDDYHFFRNKKEEKSLERDIKIKQKGKGYSLETLFGTEIFDIFEDTIPEIIKLNAFGEHYGFEFDKKYGIKNIEKDLFRVRYNIPVNPQSTSDKFRINEPIVIDLKKENGKYHIFRGKINGEFKFIFWIPFNVGVLEKGYEWN